MFIANCICMIEEWVWEQSKEPVLGIWKIAKALSEIGMELKMQHANAIHAVGSLSWCSA